MTYGYERPLARYIYITNTGDGDAVIDRVQVSGAAYSVGGKGDLVKAGETMTSRRIQPSRVERGNVCRGGYRHL